MAAGVEGQSELIEAVFDTGQRIHRLVPTLKDRRHVVAVPEVGVDAEISSRVVVEGVEGEVGQNLTGTGTDRYTLARAVNPNEQLEDGDGSGTLEHPADLGHQPIVIDAVEKLTNIRLEVVAVSAGRQVMRQLLRALMDAATDKT